MKTGNSYLVLQRAAIGGTQVATQALREFESLKASHTELLATLARIAAMDVSNAQAAVLARNEARDAIDKAAQS